MTFPEQGSEESSIICQCHLEYMTCMYYMPLLQVTSKYVYRNLDPIDVQSTDTINVF